MRKITGLMLVAILSIVLVACGSNKTEKTTLVLEEEGIKSTVTYEADGDKVLKQSTENEASYDAFQIESKEEAEALLADVFDEFTDIKGLTHEVEYLDDSFVETLTIDYEEADIDDIRQLPGSEFDGDTDGRLSLKGSVEMLESIGYEKLD